MGVYDEYLQRVSWGRAEPLHNWVSRRILKVFQRQAMLRPEVTKILEIGSGIGRVGLLARQFGYASYEGVEPTRVLAAFCRERHGLTIIEEALPNLTRVPDQTYGAVVSIHVLEHASNHHEAREWCNEMARVVQPGGAICIVAPDIRDYKQHFWDSDWSHGYPTTPQRVGQVLKDIGLSVEFQGSMHFGGINLVSAFAAHVVAALLPTGLGDSITKWIVGRPLVSGLKIALLWGNVFVVARKPTD
jgi:SAM-dependent methyltransferase